MIQEINLYQPMFRRERKVFTAVTLAQITGVVFLALMAIYAWQEVSTTHLEARLGQLRTQQEQATKRLSALLTERTRVSPALSKAVADARATVARQEAALEILSRPSQSNTEGFSRPLKALGRAVIPGLWLTHLELDAGGTEITLGGRMSAAARLPRYLDALGKQAPFARQRFALLHIEREKKHPDTLGFTLSTVAKKPKGGAK